MLGRLGPWEIIAILAVIVLIFGSKKLPELAKSIGRSVVELKEGLKSSSETDDSSNSESKE